MPTTHVLPPRCSRNSTTSSPGHRRAILSGMRTLVCLLLVGCSGSDNHSQSDMAAGTLRLISGDYSLDAGQEKFVCVRKTVAADLFITEITPVNGQATHHQVLGIDTTSTLPDGTAECANNV